MGGRVFSTRLACCVTLACSVLLVGLTPTPAQQKAAGQGADASTFLGPDDRRRLKEPETVAEYYVAIDFQIELGDYGLPHATCTASSRCRRPGGKREGQQRQGAAPTSGAAYDRSVLKWRLLH